MRLSVVVMRRISPLRFQFTHPGKGATPPPRHTYRGIRGFNSRTLGRVRRTSSNARTNQWQSFNSRTLGRVRLTSSRVISCCLCFNSRTLGRVRLCSSSPNYVIYKVSIHAPWEGCDVGDVAAVVEVVVVSIHAPWEGCDLAGE